MITLATLPTATAQQVVEQAIRHLMLQNRKSIKVSSLGLGQCQYLNENGLKCVAGCFMGDDEYRPRMEGESWASLVNQGLVPDAHHSLIEHLQAVHDDYNIENWPRELRWVVDQHYLDWPSDVFISQETGDSK